MLKRTGPNLSWPAIIAHAAEIVRSYDTGVMLRQLFYRLFTDGMLPNTRSAYQYLSDRTATARREGTFPDLIDKSREIHRYQSFGSPEEAREWLPRIYRRDRTEGQEWSIYLGAEKRGNVEQLKAWFGDLGVPILALGGYTSQSYVNEVVADVHRQGRPAVLLYAGDFDPSGEDIIRDFTKRAPCFDELVRVALTDAQVAEYNLPENTGKLTDSRAAAFTRRNGRLCQVELDALDPTDLKALFDQAIGEYWDRSAYFASVEQEQRDREQLEADL